MNIKFAKIKKITQIEDGKSYDFAVEDEHRIIAREVGSINSFYTSNCWHPDIEEFITAKQTEGRLTKFNMSALITDDFMDAVENNLPWNLEFPDFEKHKEDYKKHWDGNIRKWKDMGYPTTVYKTFENANELWDVIMKSTYNRNEPGVLFVDTMNRLNNLNYCEYINSTNPCGEQILPIGGVCLLGSINLTQFVESDKNDWNYDKLGEYIPSIVRLMDNVNDITFVPLDYQKKNLSDKRRIGLGIMGYASALMMMKIRYGSEDALNITDKLMSFIANNAYQASALIAKEKGSFTLFDSDKFLKSQFIKQALSDETISMIEEYGLRNSHLLSIQPTGNTSIFANNVSGGLEPIFMTSYIRTSMMPYAPKGLDVPKNVNWSNNTYESTTDWSWIKEGDEALLATEFEGYLWKYDKNRGLLRETVVEDYSVRHLKELGQWDPEASYVATTTELEIDEHVDTMGVLAKYIDSAMSKTINLPNDYPYDKFKDLYMKLYKTGVVKGGTSYRAGTMTTVLSSTDKNDTTLNMGSYTRPEKLACDIHHLQVHKRQWIVCVGLHEDTEKPIEVFAFMKKNISVSKKVKSGFLIKDIKKNQYNLEMNDVIIENLKESFESDEQEALTRLISVALQGGTSINRIYTQLQKSEGSVVSFAKAIARTLKKYLEEDNKSMGDCPSCGSKDSLFMQEGCYVCKDCSYSKCG